MWPLLLGGLLAGLCAGTALAHQVTFSQVDIRLPAQAQHQVQYQAQQPAQVTVMLPIAALLHERPSALPAGTTVRELQATPLPAATQQALAGLLLARLHFAAQQQPLPLKVLSIQPADGNIRLTATLVAPTEVLNVQANLFPDDPLHKIFVNVYGGGKLLGQYALDRQDSSFALAFTLAAPSQSLWQTLLTFNREGIHHIFIGPDHILFVLALVLLGGRLATQLEIITAFTVAHSLTLVLATLNIVQLPSRLVESTIALSIVVVGLYDLRQLRLARQSSGVVGGPAPRIFFAFIFGLVHGFGFASVLRELDLPQQALAWSLAAFNVGVEVGQVTVLLVAAVLLWLLRCYAAPAVNRWSLMVVASVVVLVGGCWFVQRALGL